MVQNDDAIDRAQRLMVLNLHKSFQLYPNLAMLDRAKVCSVLAGRASLKTAQPEDVIGLKVQAMFNDPVRRLQEQRDIEALLGRYGSQLDWSRIQEFYDVFGLVSEAKELRRRFDRAQ